MVHDSEQPVPALNSLTTGVMLVSAGGRVRYANAAAENLTGLSEARLRELDVRMVFEGAADWIRRFSEGGRDRSPFVDITEVRVPGSVGSEGKLRVAVSEYPDSPEGLLMLEISDYGLALQAESREQQAGLSETSRQVFRNLAHEIKNPLGGIRGAAQLLDSELEDPEQHEYTEVIIHEADRLQALVDRLLAPYRSRRTVTEVNVHEVLERVRTLLGAEFPEGLAFVRDYDVSLPPLKGDFAQLQQVFLNIMRNAAEALSSQIREGTAEIRLMTRTAHQIQIGRHRYRSGIRIHVIDNGPGIPEEIRERIFYPLVTGKPDGSGLGLSLAQSFVRQHGGVIDVVSEPGKTDFSVLLPYAEASEPQQSAEEIRK